MFRFLVLASMVVAGGVFAVRQLDTSVKPQQAQAAPAPVSSAARARNLLLKKDARGHFKVDALIDGRRLELMVDTGASAIALRESDAARLGIYPRRSDYTVKVSTANGITSAALVELRSVEVGDLLVRNVRALVQPDAALGVNLLGMSFLSRVRWTHERGTLVLEQ